MDPKIETLMASYPEGSIVRHELSDGLFKNTAAQRMWLTLKINQRPLGSAWYETRNMDLFLTADCLRNFLGNDVDPGAWLASVRYCNQWPNDKYQTKVRDIFVAKLDGLCDSLDSFEGL